MTSTSTAPQSIPQPERLSSSLTIQAPLTGRGYGPGLVIVSLASISTDVSYGEHIDPAPQQKWAEEGYVVAHLKLSEGFTVLRIRDELREATEALSYHAKCTSKSTYGIIVHTPSAYPDIVEAINGNGEIKCIVSFGALATISRTPTMSHLAEKGSKSTEGKSVLYRYPEVKSPLFVIPGHPDFHPSTSAVAHSRSLEFLKKQLGGPLFDLEDIWEQHTAFEFTTRSVDDTMGTMVQEPYVNHIPTMTGGIGREKLTCFYRDHFIFSNPDDADLQLVSRTVGMDRVVDEFVYVCTHNREIDWLAPGVPATGKYLRVPMVAVVNIRGDKLYHEHIYWDQLTVLFQMGLMPEYLKFPYPLAGGKVPEGGKTFEYHVPGAGDETAAKLLDETALESNKLFQFKVREVPE